MANADLNNLQNINPLELNTTVLQNGTELPTTMFAYVRSYVGDFWFVVIIVILFIFFNWLFFRREEGFGYDISRTALISSGYCLLISSAFLLANWITTLEPVIWFASSLFISFLGVWSLKQKNR